jgi:hypothetical protein
MIPLTDAFLAAVAVLAISLFVSACAPRQPPGGDLWRVVQHIDKR